MKTIKISNLGSIQSIFNDNTKNTYYHKIISKKLEEIDSNIEFATPIIQESKGTIDWLTKYDGNSNNYSSLTNTDKKRIDNEIQIGMDTIKKLLSSNDNDAFFESIIEIPNESSIFYTTDSFGKIRIIITEWGYVSDEHKNKSGILKKIFTTTLKSFIFNFKSKNNESLEGIETIITADGTNNILSSDEDGIIRLNNLNRKNPLQIKSRNQLFKDLSLDINEINEYTITIKTDFTITIEFLDENNQAITDKNYDFKSDVLENEKFTTDSQGRFVLAHKSRKGNFKIQSENGDKLLVETLKGDDQFHTIKIATPKIEEEIEEIEEIEEEEEIIETPIEKEEIQLEFLNWRKKPIQNQTVSVYKGNEKPKFTTDQNGIINIETEFNNIVCAVFMNYKGTDWLTEFTPTSDKKKYTFIVKRKKMLWWWLPLFVFFFLLLLIPTEVKHDYIVLDKNTKQPIDSALISSSQPSSIQVSDYNKATDNKGKIDISYGKIPLYKQIFKPYTTNTTASKQGYEDLTAEINLKYFKTQKSIYYLSKIKHPKRVIPIAGCNSGGDGGDDGKNSTKEFDLKQDSGTFNFTYYTGEMLADKITIYNCNKFEIANNTPIFEFDDVTIMAPQTVTLNFSSPIITVIVDGRGTLGSVWQYRVECPN